MRDRQRAERGFILVTSLLILAILTVMLTGLYYRNQINVKTSLSDRDATKAYYMAEAGLNYITWALYSDPKDPWAKNDRSLDGDSLPDNQEILDNPDQVANHTLGYFDIKNTIDFDPQAPHGLALASLSMPPHVALDIKVNAQNVPSIVAKPWDGGKSKPAGDGVAIWVVPSVLDQTGDAMKEKDTGATNTSYDLVGYCVAYVHGKPIRIIRAKIGSMIFGFPTNLGATTNSYQ